MRASYVVRQVINLLIGGKEFICTSSDTVIRTAMRSNKSIFDVLSAQTLFTHVLARRFAEVYGYHPIIGGSWFIKETCEVPSKYQIQNGYKATTHARSERIQFLRDYLRDLELGRTHDAWIW